MHLAPNSQWEDSKNIYLTYRSASMLKDDFDCKRIFINSKRNTYANILHSTKTSILQVVFSEIASDDFP